MAANPLLDPNSTLSGNALLAAAKGLANAQTSPVIASLAQMIAQNNAQTSGALNQVGGYFNQLGQQAQQGAGQQQSVADALNSQLAQIGQDEQSQLRGIGQNATDSVLKYSPQSDASNSLAQPALQSLASEIARQQGLAAQNQGAQRSFGATQGANYRGMAAANLGTFALKGQESLGNIAKAGQLRNQPLQAKIANEHAIYGADLATALGKLRQQEIVNNISRAGLGLKQESLNQAAKQNSARNALTARGQNVTLNGQQLAQMRSDRQFKLDQQKFGASQAKDNYLRTHGLGSYRPSRAAGGGSGRGGALTPGQNNRSLTALGQITNAITTWQQGGMKDRSGNVTEAHPTNAQMRQVLGGKYDPVLVQAAFELQGWGHITPQTAAAMHRQGMRGGTYRGAPIKVAPAPKGTPGGGLFGGSSLGQVLGIK